MAGGELKDLIDAVKGAHAPLNASEIVVVRAFHRGIQAKPANEPAKAEAPDFNGWLYSVDAFVPVDLKQLNAWTPHDEDWEALAAFEIALGWIATALLIGAVTGVLRRD